MAQWTLSCLLIELAGSTDDRLEIKILVNPVELFTPEVRRTSIYVASAPELEGVSGKYFSNGKEATAPRQSYDEAAASRLWRVCEQLTRISVQGRTTGNLDANVNA